MFKCKSAAKKNIVGPRSTENRVHLLTSMSTRTHKARYHFEDIAGVSDAIKNVLHISKKIAQGNGDILIVGESGTGKELFAQSIHNASPRLMEPFVPVSCATLIPSLIESELFGYEDGAFTGSRKGGKAGFFEIADGGTVFLDEIGELPLEMQSKLLRTLQERSIRRIGTTTEFTVDVRVIAATNKDLKLMVNEGKFREDLYYRLDVIGIHLPPLRNRIGDVRNLTDYFLETINNKMQRQLTLSSDVYEIFSQYQWPGNVRELIHVLEFAVHVCEGSVIKTCDLPKAFTANTLPKKSKKNTLAEITRDMERTIIEDRLKSYGVTLSAKKKIANELGISLASLYSKIKTINMNE